MPRIPRMTGPQVRSQPRPTPQVSADALGAPIAQVAGAFGREFQRIAEEERQKVNQVQVNGAEVELRRERDRLLYDRDTGALTRQRKQVIGATNTFADEWRRAESRILATIADPDARAEAQARSAQVFAEAETMVRRHADRELDLEDDETATALMTQELQKASEMAMDTAVVDGALGRAEGLLRGRMGRAGRNELVIEQAVEKMRGQARLSQIDALLTRGNVEMARTVFTQHADALDDKQRQDAEKAIQTAEQGQSVQRAALTILAASDSPTERNAMIAELPIGIRKGVRDLVQAEQKAAQDARKLEQEEAFAKVEEAVVNGSSLSNPTLAPLLAKLSTSQRQTLDRYAQAPTNDNAAWLEWYQLSSDPKKLAAMTESEFRAHWSRLATGHRDDAERDYRKARETANAPEGARAYITPQTIIARAMRNVGGVAPFAPLSQIDEDLQPMVAQFEMRASEEIAAERGAKGRDLTPPEIQAVVDRMQRTFVRESRQPYSEVESPFGTLRFGGRRRQEEARAFQMLPSDTTGIFAGTTRIRLSEIPADALSGVDNILRANNIALTDSNREALYTIRQFDLDGSRTAGWITANRR